MYNDGCTYVRIRQSHYRSTTLSGFCGSLFASLALGFSLAGVKPVLYGVGRASGHFGGEDGPLVAVLALEHHELLLLLRRELFVLAELFVEPALDWELEAVGSGAEHGKEAEDELTVAHAQVRRVRLVHVEQVRVERQLPEEVGVRPLVDAVAELLLVELRRAHVEALEHLEHKLGLRRARDGVHRQRVVLDELALDLVQLLVRLAVEFLVHLEPGEAERGAVREAPAHERKDGGETLLAVHHLHHGHVLLVEEDGWDRNVEQEGLNQARRSPRRPHKLALIRRLEIHAPALDLINQTIHREICLLDLQQSPPGRFPLFLAFQLQRSLVHQVWCLLLLLLLLVVVVGHICVDSIFACVVQHCSVVALLRRGRRWRRRRRRLGGGGGGDDEVCEDDFAIHDVDEGVLAVASAAASAAALLNADAAEHATVSEDDAAEGEDGSRPAGDVVDTHDFDALWHVQQALRVAGSELPLHYDRVAPREVEAEQR
mmetsp:Transcript_24577/g.80278  ORF Transcript_24577/g.80278 Transcript_24577/m.80278 type:complete len:487 (-) Transcript_24577:426-1886(-)